MGRTWGTCMCRFKLTTSRSTNNTNTYRHATSCKTAVWRNHVNLHLYMVRILLAWGLSWFQMVRREHDLPEAKSSSNIFKNMSNIVKQFLFKRANCISCCISFDPPTTWHWTSWVFCLGTSHPTGNFLRSSHGGWIRPNGGLQRIWSQDLLGRWRKVRFFWTCQYVSTLVGFRNILRCLLWSLDWQRAGISICICPTIRKCMKAFRTF